MNAEKQHGWVRRAIGPARYLVSPFTGHGAGPLIAVVLAVVMLAGWYLGWAKFGPVVMGQRRHMLKLESLEIPRVPPWIHADIRAEAMRDGSLNQISVLDPELTKRVARAFELHTWVARVKRVAKKPGKNTPRIVVDLDYRKPAIMVKADGGFWPVDTEGVLLPPDEFSRAQTRDFLRVCASNRQPAGPVGTPYGDVGIAGAARVAAVLLGKWKEIGLEWIVVEQDSPRSPGEPMRPSFVLLPAGTPSAELARRSASSRNNGNSEAEANTEVLWGHAPGQEVVGEVRFREKVTRLVTFVRQHGSLDKQPQAVVIDLRPRPGVTIIPRKQRVLPASLH